MNTASFRAYKKRLAGLSAAPVCGASVEEDDLWFAAFNLHNHYCVDVKTCEWEQEESCDVLNPWVLPAHLRWLMLAERLRDAGIPLDAALEASLEFPGKDN